jgi:Flp pilus assembly protein TadG
MAAMIRPSKIAAALVRKVGRFRRDTRGLAAVEFALILPVMLVVYFGTLETTNALTCARRVTNVAETAADLVAQVPAVSSSDLTDIFAASTAILTPFNTTPVKIVLTSVTANSSNVTTVAWSAAYGSGATARTANSSITLPTGLTTAGTSVIMAEVTYTYTSPIGTFITGPITMTEKAYLRPRRSVSVAKTS